MSSEVATPRNYCTVPEVKIRLAEGDPASDPKIEAAIPVASRAIDNFKGVPESYYNNEDEAGYSETHYYDGNNDVDLWIDRCTSIETVTMEYPMGTPTVWVEATDFVVQPYNTPYISHLQVRQEGDHPYWYWGQRNIAVAAWWGGYTEAPQPVNMACIILVARYIQGGQQMFEEQSAISEFGQLIWKDPEGMRVRNLLKAVEGAVYVG